MILCVDIGNTNISFGILRGGKIIAKFDIPVAKYEFHRLKLKLRNEKAQAAIICSVVPKMTKVLRGDLQKILKIKPKIVGSDIKVPLKNLYRKPKQVGQDRLVNAYAGVRLYGAPLILIDFGTAVTFDVVSKHGAYLGGLILPGLGLSLRALAEHTALLPRIKLTKPREFIGRDTKMSMLSGIVNGLGLAADGLISRIKKITGKGTKVIATGGNIRLMQTYCRDIDKVDTELTLDGLGFLVVR